MLASLQTYGPILGGKFNRIVAGAGRRGRGPNALALFGSRGVAGPISIRGRNSLERAVVRDLLGRICGERGTGMQNCISAYRRFRKRPRCRKRGHRPEDNFGAPNRECNIQRDVAAGGKSKVKPGASRLKSSNALTGRPIDGTRTNNVGKRRQHFRRPAGPRRDGVRYVITNERLRPLDPKCRDQ